MHVGFAATLSIFPTIEGGASSGGKDAGAMMPSWHLLGWGLGVGGFSKHVCIRFAWFGLGPLALTDWLFDRRTH